MQEECRLLLSWKEQATSCEYTHPKPAQLSDTPDAFEGYQKTQAEKATRRLEDFRRREQGVLKQLAQRLQRALQAQDRFLDRLSTNNLRPTHVNALNRKHSMRIASLRKQIAFWNQLCSAQTAAEMGGFIDKPLERYAVEAGPALPSFWARLPHKERTQISVSVLGVILAVLLVLSFTLYGRTLQCSVSPPYAPQGILTLHCKNNTLETVSFVIPKSLSSHSTDAYSVEVYGQEALDGPFRLLPSDMAWTYQERPTYENEKISLAAGLQADFFLALARLSVDTAELKALQLRCYQGENTSPFYVYTHPLHPQGGQSSL